MAGRPTKDGLDYFPLEVGFFADDKIEKLEGEHGPIGVYVLMRLLCLIYKDNGYYYVWDDSARALMARRTGGACTPQKADLIVRSCVKWSLLDGKLLDKYGVLSSKGIQQRYLHAIRERAKKAAASERHIRVDQRLWLLDKETTERGFVKVGLFSENDGKNADYSGEKSNCSAEKSDKVKKRREKERKEKESMDAAALASGPSHRFGVVSLPEKDYSAMVAEFGKETVDAKIIHMDAWFQNHGDRPKSYASTLRDWLANDAAKMKQPQATQQGKRTGAHAYEQRAYDDDELEALLYTPFDELNAE